MSKSQPSEIKTVFVDNGTADGSAALPEEVNGKNTGAVASVGSITFRQNNARLVSYWAMFFVSICYWELFLGWMSQGSLSNINLWFVIFAVPQALVFAALSGWGKDRFNRILAVILLLILFSFYTAQFIFYRAFGSMISLSMIGMGGDAMDDFGWAMMVTIKESAILLFFLSIPLLISIIWIFIWRPSAGRIRFLTRPVALIVAMLLWLLAGPVLRLGGTGESSAYRAYVSSLVDADTSSRRIGVLTTSIMDLRSSMSEEDYDREIADTVGSAVSSDVIEIPVNSAAAVTMAPTPASVSDEVTNEEADLSEETESEDGNAPFGEESLPETEGAADDENSHKQSDLSDDTETEAAVPLSPALNIFDSIDFSYLASIAEQDSVRSLCEYFATVPGTNKNGYTGMLEGYNLIFVCAESFCSYAISEEVTPTLYRMSNEGIVLTNFYNSFKNTTTNGEFSFMTGLWPDVSRKADKGVTTGSFGQSVKHFMPYGLGNVFSELGVKSFAFHNYLGRYYGRAQTHANLGYKCKFMGEMKFTNKWPSSDYEMMLQSVDDYIYEDRFNVYYMTFSGHGPYRTDNNAISKTNAPSVPKTLNGRKLDSVARCYIANNLELEYSMEYLLQRLEEEDKLDNTLIVLMGDHYPYYLTDAAAKSILGTLPEKDFERYHSTCIMWFASEEPIICDTPCCNVDILPTVLNLLGIPFDSRMLSGTDIFSDSLHAAMLYNKNFITDSVKYDAANGKTKWLVDTDDLNSEQMQAYVDNVYSIMKARYAAALSINKTDFYRFVWENSVLLQKDEQENTTPAVPETEKTDSNISDDNTVTEPQTDNDVLGFSLTVDEKRLRIAPVR